MALTGMLRVTLLGWCLAGCGLASGQAAVEFSSGPDRVTLLELYTSEGCSSCPPAEHWLGSLRTQPGLWTTFVPVAFHVKYWDYLGWRDPFAQEGFTQRQYRYGEEWRTGSVYTPAFVRNGHEWRQSHGEPIAAAAGPAGVLSLSVSEARQCRVTFTPAGVKPFPPHALRVTVALLGGGVRSAVKRGENAGRELVHEFVVLELVLAALKPESGAAFAAELQLPLDPTARTGIPRRAIAAWVTAGTSQVPLQATGGWLGQME